MGRPRTYGRRTRSRLAKVRAIHSVTTAIGTPTNVISRPTASESPVMSTTKATRAIGKPVNR